MNYIVVYTELGTMMVQQFTLERSMRAWVLEFLLQHQTCQHSKVCAIIVGTVEYNIGSEVVKVT